MGNSVPPQDSNHEPPFGNRPQQALRNLWHCSAGVASRKSKSNQVRNGSGTDDSHGPQKSVSACKSL